MASFLFSVYPPHSDTTLSNLFAPFSSIPEAPPERRFFRTIDSLTWLRSQQETVQLSARSQPPIGCCMTSTTDPDGSLFTCPSTPCDHDFAFPKASFVLARPIILAATSTYFQNLPFSLRDQIYSPNRYHRWLVVWWSQ